MRDAEEVMDEFLTIWNNMLENQSVQLGSLKYDEIKKAFSLEKKIVATYDSCDEEDFIEETDLKLIRYKNE